MNKDPEQKSPQIREIMHGVKNHLQVLNSLFDLQLMDIKNEAAALAVQESLGRLRVMTVVYKNLSIVDFYQTVDFERVVIEIYKQTSQTNSKIENAIKSALHLPDLILDVNTAIPLGLILNELLVNSFTQNHKQGLEREISIQRIASDTEIQCIEYIDTGLELPEPFDLNDSRLPFGMRLVNGLSRQIGGRTEVPLQSKYLFRIFFKK